MGLQWMCVQALVCLELIKYGTAVDVCTGSCVLGVDQVWDCSGCVYRLLCAWS